MYNETLWGRRYIVNTVPKKLTEIVGQEHITKTLEQALKQGRVSHAYLFTGPHGVGKTSVARILAHEINGLPYEDDSAHIDIIEIDAASNRRIDEIRELREKVYVAPISARYKVYIIDEVHMLTREAFNALLKTLEEPPAHVVFILATTDAHKLPETIISRTQRFSFKPADDTRAFELLKRIAQAEKINIDDDALELLAKHGAGSFRDSVSLLDQAASHHKKVEIADVRRLLGIPSQEAVDDLIDLLATGANASAIMQSLQQLADQGYQANIIARQLSQSLRSRLADNSPPLSDSKVLELLRQLVEVPASRDPERLLEITLLQHAVTTASTATESNPILAKQVLSATEPAKPQLKAMTSKASDNKTPMVAQKSFNKDIWEEVLQTLKQRYNTLYGVLRMAQPDFSEAGRLKLTFAFSFHQRRLLENSNRQKLTEVIREKTGQAVDIDCAVDKSAKPLKTTSSVEPAASSDDLSAISNIFGSAELLES